MLKPNEEGRIEVAFDTGRFVGPKTQSLYLTIEQRGISETFVLSITANSSDAE
jgi:hypothetical protein